MPWASGTKSSPRRPTRKCAAFWSARHARIPPPHERPREAIVTLPSAISEQLVTLTADSASLEGNLALPPEARGIVLFAHGSGSSRHSPRNRYVARELNDAGLATLLIDLLKAEEEATDRRTA